MSVGVPGPRPTLSRNLVTSPPVRVRIDPNSPTATMRPMSEVAAQEGLESYYESTTDKKRRTTCSLKDDAGKEEDGKEGASHPRPRSFIKRLFGLR